MADLDAGELSLRVLHGYFEALRSLEPERIARMFAEDGEIEDPVGGPVRRGRGQIAEYFAGGMCTLASSVEIDLLVALPAGRSIAAHWRMTAHSKAGRSVDAEGIDVLAVNEDGSIQRAEGYWDLGAFRRALAAL